MRKLSFIVICLSLPACSQAELLKPSLSEITALCTQTVKDYAVLRDEGPAEDYANLFVNEGQFQLGGSLVQGREALMTRHKGANKAAFWRHSMTDIRITKTDDVLRGKSRFIVMSGPRSQQNAPRFTRQIVGDYQDVFVMDGKTCKIKSRKVNILFDNQD